MLGKGQTDDINGNIGAAEKISINFSKTKAKLCLILHYNDANSYFFVNRKEIYKFEADIKYVNFPTQFFLETYLINVKKYHL